MKCSLSNFALFWDWQLIIIEQVLGWPDHKENTFSSPNAIPLVALLLLPDWCCPLSRHNSFISQYGPVSFFNCHTYHFYIPTYSQTGLKIISQIIPGFEPYHYLYYVTTWNFLCTSQGVPAKLSQICLPHPDWQSKT